MANIPISKEFGLNPTIPVCFYCGEAKNEIALLGTKYKGPDGKTAEAPHYMLMDYTPCDKCAGMMAQGITIMEIVPVGKSKYPALAKEGTLAYVAPTGRWSVVTEEAIERWHPDNADEIIKARRTLMEHPLYEAIFGDTTEGTSNGS